MHPGLVRVLDTDHADFKSDALRDPVYALQVLPNCRIVEISNSIKGLAKIISEIPEFEFMLQQAPKGSLVIHALACTGHVQQGTTRSQTSKTSTSSRRCYIGIVEKEISSCTEGFQQGAIVVATANYAIFTRRSGRGVSLQMSKRHDALAQSKLASRAGQC
jgi:hypothetical protein